MMGRLQTDVYGFKYLPAEELELEQKAGKRRNKLRARGKVKYDPETMTFSVEKAKYPELL